jgi:DNA-binding LacI/PurR family transcriptional regulator
LTQEIEQLKQTVAGLQTQLNAKGYYVFLYMRERERERERERGKR